MVGKVGHACFKKLEVRINEMLLKIGYPAQGIRHWESGHWQSVARSGVVNGLKLKVHIA